MDTNERKRNKPNPPFDRRKSLDLDQAMLEFEQAEPGADKFIARIKVILAEWAIWGRDR
jgi:hypothetical protein